MGVGTREESQVHRLGALVVAGVVLVVLARAARARATRADRVVTRLPDRDARGRGRGSAWFRQCQIVLLEWRDVGNKEARRRGQWVGRLFAQDSLDDCGECVLEDCLHVTRMVCERRGGNKSRSEAVRRVRGRVVATYCCSMGQRIKTKLKATCCYPPLKVWFGYVSYLVDITYWLLHYLVSHFSSRVEQRWLWEEPKRVAITYAKAAAPSPRCPAAAAPHAAC